MKKGLFIVIFLMSLTAFSQNSHMGLSMGPSFPVGDFSGEGNYKTNGYAKPGFDLSFDANYIPTWYFGIGGQLLFASNYPNSDTMLYDLLLELYDLGVRPPLEGNTDFSIENWSYVNVMIGPTLALPAGNFQFNIKAYLGISFVMSPSQSIAIKYDTETIAGYSSPQNVAFCYSLGSDIIYKLNGNYSLKIGAEYFHAKTDCDLELAYDDDRKLPVIHREIKIGSIHTTIGLAYLF
jgi:hypothetical protein